jgi:hypothetical protein
MIEIKLKLSKNDRIIISDTWVSNGHYMVLRSLLINRTDVQAILKPFKSLLMYKVGNYRNGVNDLDAYDESIPDFNGVIPKDEGYTTMPVEPLYYNGRNNKINAAVYRVKPVNGKAFKIGVNPVYALLFALGTAYAKDARRPIIVKSSDNSIIAVVMPVRL